MFISSMRLAKLLLVYLASASILASFVPQGLEAKAYAAMYPSFVSKLLVGSGFTMFFSSAFFILPGFLFFANLSACTAKRFVREIKKKGRKRFGPDILHCGLMLLIIGSTLSYVGRTEGAVELIPGDSVQLPDGSTLSLLDFQYERYDDGRPKAWVSLVELRKSGQSASKGYKIQVNKPLRYSGFTVYQSAYREIPVLRLDGPDGQYNLVPGKELVLSDIRVRYLGAHADGEGRVLALVQVSDSHGERIARLGVGEELVSLRMIGLDTRMASTLAVVKDSAFFLVVLAYLLITVGISMTFIQKAKDAA